MKPKLPFPIPVSIEIVPEEVQNISQMFLDVSYSDISDEHILDIYLPKKVQERYPLIIYIHEGAFAFGSKRDVRIKSTLKALERGYAIASIEYRKSDKVSWPAQIYDVKAAIRFLRQNAESYKLDKTKFAIWGASAGGYLAAIVGVTIGNPAFEDLTMGCKDVDSSVQAVIDFSGACGRLDEIDQQLIVNGIGRAVHNFENSPESIMMGNALPEIKELIHMVSPITYVTPDIPPIFVQHSILDDVVPIQQSEKFVEAIYKIAGKEKVEFYICEDAGNHENPMFEMRQASEKAIDFLDKVLRNILKNEVYVEAVK